MRNNRLFSNSFVSNNNPDQSQQQPSHQQQQQQQTIPPTVGQLQRYRSTRQQQQQSSSPSNISDNNSSNVPDNVSDSNSYSNAYPNLSSSSSSSRINYNNNGPTPIPISSSQRSKQQHKLSGMNAFLVPFKRLLPGGNNNSNNSTNSNNGNSNYNQPIDGNTASRSYMGNSNRNRTDQNNYGKHNKLLKNKQENYNEEEFDYSDDDEINTNNDDDDGNDYDNSNEYHDENNYRPSSQQEQQRSQSNNYTYPINSNNNRGNSQSRNNISNTTNEYYNNRTTDDYDDNEEKHRPYPNRSSEKYPVTVTKKNNDSKNYNDTNPNLSKYSSGGTTQSRILNIGTMNDRYDYNTVNNIKSTKTYEMDTKRGISTSSGRRTPTSVADDPDMDDYSKNDKNYYDTGGVSKTIYPDKSDGYIPSVSSSTFLSQSQSNKGRDKQTKLRSIPAGTSFKPLSSSSGGDGGISTSLSRKLPDVAENETDAENNTNEDIDNHDGKNNRNTTQSFEKRISTDRSELQRSSSSIPTKSYPMNEKLPSNDNIIPSLSLNSTANISQGYQNAIPKHLIRSTNALVVPSSSSNPNTPPILSSTSAGGVTPNTVGTIIPSPTDENDKFTPSLTKPTDLLPLQTVIMEQQKIIKEQTEKINKLEQLLRVTTAVENRIGKLEKNSQGWQKIADDTVNNYKTELDKFIMEWENRRRRFIRMDLKKDIAPYETQLRVLADKVSILESQSLTDMAKRLGFLLFDFFWNGAVIFVGSMLLLFHPVLNPVWNTCKTCIRSPRQARAQFCTSLLDYVCCCCRGNKPNNNDGTTKKNIGTDGNENDKEEDVTEPPVHTQRYQSNRRMMGKTNSLLGSKNYPSKGPNLVKKNTDIADENGKTYSDDSDTNSLNNDRSVSLRPSFNNFGNTMSLGTVNVVSSELSSVVLPLNEEKKKNVSMNEKVISVTNEKNIRKIGKLENYTDYDTTNNNIYPPTVPPNVRNRKTNLSTPSLEYTDDSPSLFTTPVDSNKNNGNNRSMNQFRTQKNRG